jgi:hypothetical protein
MDPFMQQQLLQQQVQQQQQQQQQVQQQQHGAGAYHTLRVPSPVALAMQQHPMAVSAYPMEVPMAMRSGLGLPAMVQNLAGMGNGHAQGGKGPSWGLEMLAEVANDNVGPLAADGAATGQGHNDTESPGLPMGWGAAKGRRTQMGRKPADRNEDDIDTDGGCRLVDMLLLCSSLVLCRAALPFAAVLLCCAQRPMLGGCCCSLAAALPPALWC